MSKPKVLFWDIETTHNIVATFPVFKANINYKMVLENWYILCASYSWLGDKKVHTVSVMDDPARFAKNQRDDYHVLKHMHEVLSQADAIIAHNGDKFDLKKYRARLAYHRLPPLPNCVQIDTLKMAKTRFGFTFNRLDYLARFLGVGKKIKTDEELWLECRAGNINALNKMIRYNKQDIRVLKSVYKIMAPHAPAKLNYNHFSNTDCCPLCGSTRITTSKYFYNRVSKMRQIYCKACTHYSSRPVTKTGKVGVIR